MGLFKKNPIFCVVILVCLLVFATGAYLAFAKAGAVERAQREVSSAKSQLDSLLNASPAPSEANVEASAENVAQLREELNAIRENLQRGSRLTASTDGVGVMASIQQFITEYQRKVANNTTDGEPDPIETPENFAFGFSAYIDEARVPENQAVIPILDKQRQILSYILNQLIDANPESIEKVQREIVEQSAAKSSSGNKDKGQGFSISPAISARVPGAIDTKAFTVTFTGYTDVLRDFLNNLATFKLPIVVRSIEVERPSGAETTAGAQESRNQLDDIFSVFGGGGGEAEESEQAPPQEAQKPVIAENISRFTVTLEFIEIILPSETEETSS